MQSYGWASKYTPIPRELQDLAREENFSGSFAKGCDQGTLYCSLVIRAIRISAPTLLEDLTDTSLDVVDQGERVELLELFGQFLFLFLRNMPREQDPLVGRQRLVMFALDLFSDTVLFDLLHRRDEIVQQEPKCSAIQGVEHGHDGRVVKPVVAEVLTHHAPVFLFDMSVVVGMVRSSTGEVHQGTSLLQVVEQLPVDKLGAVVAVEAAQQKGKILLDRCESGNDTMLPTPPQRPLFGLSRGDVDKVHRVGVGSTDRGPAMSNGIGLEVPWTIFLPYRTLDRNLGAENRPRLGCRQSEFPVLLSIPRKKPIDR